MLALNPSTAQTAIRKVTGIIEVHTAGSIAVCREGSKVALHIATTEGEVLVHMRERDFVRSCRGFADHNGNPFRTLDELDEERRRVQEAAELPPREPGVTSKPGNPREAIIGDVLSVFEEIAVIANGPCKRGDVSKACRARGVEPGRFRSWHYRQKGAAA